MSDYRKRLRHAKERRVRARTAKSAQRDGSWKVAFYPDVGLTLLLNTGNYIDFLIDHDGSYESDVTAALSEELARGMGAFIDVGSHLGLHSLQVAQRFPGVTVVALEPVPSNATQQRANMLLNDLDYDLRALAVSDTSEELTLHAGRHDRPDLDYGKYNTGLASVVLDDLHDPDNSFRVPAAPLDDIAAGLDLGSGLVIKIDVEGSESRALAGMTRLIADVNRMSLVIELLFDRWPQGCEAIETRLRKSGFTMLELDGSTVEPGVRRSANYLFKRG